MNRIEITLHGEKTILVFGSWVIGRLIKEGFKLSSIEESMTENPFEFIARLTHLGAVNGTSSKDVDEFSVNDFYDWLDEVGGIESVEVAKVVKCFVNSLVANLPASKKKTVKAKTTTK